MCVCVHRHHMHTHKHTCRKKSIGYLIDQEQFTLDDMIWKNFLFLHYLSIFQIFK